MKNTFGQALTVTLFGESHGSYVGAVLDGVAPGLPVREESIARALEKRRPAGAVSTARREKDAFSLVSGVYQGYTTGTPLTVIIPNEDTRSEDYKAQPFRPGHGDFPAQMKYHGFQDPRGGGHFSARLTAPLVALSAIMTDALAEKEIFIGTHIKSIHGVEDRPFTPTIEEVLSLRDEKFPLLDPTVRPAMEEEILGAKEEGDSVGGELETVVLGLPQGLGEPWFDSLESVIAHGMFSIPAVKGISFGIGNRFATLRGSVANDGYKMEKGRVVTLTNHNGGITGGLSNGMPLTFSLVLKPTPTIAKPQHTVTAEGEEVLYGFTGRHDPCIVHRAAAVCDAMTALIVADVLQSRYGTDFWSR